jgi:hypothetical protein
MRKIKTIFALLLLSAILSASKLIVINLSTQKIYAKNNGEVLFSGNISSGIKGHRTPRGSFKIIEKDRYHVSNKYPEPNGGAKMPYMLRLTNSGVAIHQGYLPGYPASHGCIRVSKSTAIKLWRWAKVGTRVKIIGDASNFRYVRKSKKRKHYTKKRSSKKRYTKRATKKSSYKKRRYNKTNRLVRNNTGYQVVELYDDY